MKKIITLLLATMMVFTMVACGAGSDMMAATDTADFAAPAKMAGDGFVSNATNRSIDTADDMESTSADSGDKKDNTSSDEKIVYTARLYAEVLEYDKATSAVTTLVTKHGGYIQNSYESDDDGYYSGSAYVGGMRRADLTLRIPADHFEAFLNEVGDTVNVTNKSIEQENVTMEYVDLQARLKNLRAQESRIRDLLKDAKDLEQIITLDDRLTSICSDIDSYTSQMKVLENRVGYSTVNVSISEVQRITDQGNGSYFSQMGIALKHSAQKLADDAKAISLFAGSNIIQIILLAGVVTVIVVLNKKKHFFGKKVSRKGKEKEEGNAPETDSKTDA